MYVYNLKKDKFKGLLITHSSISSGRRNIMLNKNPDFNDKRKAYLVKKGYSSEQKDFSIILKKWSIDKSDKAKLRYLKKKNKKR